MTLMNLDVSFGVLNPTPNLGSEDTAWVLGTGVEASSLPSIDLGRGADVLGLVSMDTSAASMDTSLSTGDSDTSTGVTGSALMDHVPGARSQTEALWI